MIGGAFAENFFLACTVTRRFGALSFLRRTPTSYTAPCLTTRLCRLFIVDTVPELSAFEAILFGLIKIFRTKFPNQINDEDYRLTIELSIRMKNGKERRTIESGELSEIEPVNDCNHCHGNRKVRERTALVLWS